MRTRVTRANLSNTNSHIRRRQFNNLVPVNTSRTALLNPATITIRSRTSVTERFILKRIKGANKITR